MPIGEPQTRPSTMPVEVPAKPGSVPVGMLDVADATEPPEHPDAADAFAVADTTPDARVLERVVEQVERIAEPNEWLRGLARLTIAAQLAIPSEPQEEEAPE